MPQGNIHKGRPIFLAHFDPQPSHVLFCPIFMYLPKKGRPNLTISHPHTNFSCLDGYSDNIFQLQIFLYKSFFEIIAHKITQPIIRNHTQIFLLKSHRAEKRE